MIKTIATTTFLVAFLGINVAHADTDKNHEQLNQTILECAHAKLHFAYRQDNLKAHYEVFVDDKLQASDAQITHPSGEKAFDQAIIKALKDCPKYPEALRNSRFNGVFKYTR